MMFFIIKSGLPKPNQTEIIGKINEIASARVIQRLTRGTPAQGSFRGTDRVSLGIGGFWQDFLGKEIFITGLAEIDQD